MIDKTASRRKRQPPAPKQLLPHASGAALKDIEAIATVVRLKRGDRLELGTDHGNAVYIVRGGFLILTVPAGERGKTALAFCEPGSIIRGSHLLGFDMAAAVASFPSQVLRTGEAAFERLCAQSEDVRLFAAADAARQSIQDKWHVMLLSGLSGEERVACLLADLARRFGYRHGAGLFLDVPCSRYDIAEYLALNPDTLSRIFSRLRSADLIRTLSRRKIEIPDLNALMRVSPLGHVPSIGQPGRGGSFNQF